MQVTAALPQQQRGRVRQTAGGHGTAGLQSDNNRQIDHLVQDLSCLTDHVHRLSKAFNFILVGMIGLYPEKEHDIIELRDLALVLLSNINIPILEPDEYNAFLKEQLACIEVARQA